MENTFNLYSINLKEMVTELKLGEVFKVGKGVKIRALDSNGKMFIEAPSDPDADVVVLNDKVVIDVAQGKTGDQFSVGDHKYVLLADKQIYISPSLLNLEKISEIHNLTEKALDVIDTDAVNRPLQLIKSKSLELETRLRGKSLLVFCLLYTSPSPRD